jgi:hypothetical protein
MTLYDTICEIKSTIGKLGRNMFPACPPLLLKELPPTYSPIYVPPRNLLHRIVMAGQMGMCSTQKTLNISEFFSAQSAMGASFGKGLLHLSSDPRQLLQNMYWGRRSSRADNPVQIPPSRLVQRLNQRTGRHSSRADQRIRRYGTTT